MTNAVNWKVLSFLPFAFYLKLNLLWIAGKVQKLCKRQLQVEASKKIFKDFNFNGQHENVFNIPLA